MGDRLDSWKDIASYLGREVRTVQRWEGERRLPVHRLPGGDRPRVYAIRSELDQWLRTAPPETAASPSIAVLPFVNLAGDKESEYFGDGLGDDIINALTRIPGLRVTARTSSFAFRGKEQDVREIGARLGVETLLEGSVRRSNGRVRISAQLVSAADGYHLWSQTYDRDLTDIFAIQEEMARSIAQALRVHLSPYPVVPRYTSDIEAYELWLKGRCATARWTPAGVAEGLRYFEAALIRDPSFALPYVSMAQALLEGALFEFLAPAEAAPRARDLVLRGLALNPEIGEAYALLGTVRGVFEYDWTAAEQAFTHALELSPRSPLVLIQHAFYLLVPQLRFGEARDDLWIAATQDPLSAFTHIALGLTALLSRDWPTCERHCRTAVQLAPAAWTARWFLGAALMQQQRTEEALTHFREAANQMGPHPMTLGGMCSVFGWMGRSEEARQCFAEYEAAARSAPGPALPIGLAWAYLGIGDDRVFDALEQAVDAHAPGVTYLPSLFIYDGIRADRRFRGLLERMGLGNSEAAAGGR